MGDIKKVTTHTLRSLKELGERAVCITAYDYPTATFADRAGVDVILVGDSAAMTVLGHANTMSITMTEMLVFARAVARGAKRAFVIGDLPFLSYQVSDADAITNAGAFLAAGCDAVKCEGGRRVATRVRAMTDAGIAVMGHIGLTPQSFHQMGGFKIQGRDAAAADRLIEDARTLERAGAYAIVLEGIPAEVAARITAAVEIPTIGIGAGLECDGQVLVVYDMLGMNDSFKPRFVRTYEKLATRIRTAADAYVADVRDGNFPGEQESFSNSPSKQTARAEAPLAAVLHVGGCAPAPVEGEAEAPPDERPYGGGGSRHSPRARRRS